MSDPEDPDYDPDYWSCDPETCDECNPILKKKKKEKTRICISMIKANQALNTLLQNDTVMATGRFFYFNGYIEDGYRVDEKKFKINFRKGTGMLHGYVMNSDTNEMTFYHSGGIKDPSDDDNNNMYDPTRDNVYDPTWCFYKFPRCKGARKAKIILYEMVFEGFVHYGRGIIVSDIK